MQRLLVKRNQMMKRTGTSLCLLVASALLVEARVMTLKDCMDYAISHSTKIRIQQAAGGDAQIARRDAIFAATAVLALRIAFASVLWQTLRAARTNLAEELKKEQDDTIISGVSRNPQRDRSIRLPAELFPDPTPC